MGLFSFLDKPFRTGRSKAEREQRRQAAAQDARAEEAQQISREFIDLARPGFEIGQQQLQGLGELSTPEGLSSLFTQLQGSPLTAALEQERSRAVEQQLASSGLRRSGSALRAAAEVPTSVLTGLLNNIIGLKQSTAQTGLGQGSNVFGTAIRGLTTPATSLGDVQLQQAGTQAGILGGVLQGAGSLLGLSDSRSKENIERIGQFENGVGIYTYNYVGDDRKVVGVIADEVKEVMPYAVIDKHGFKHVNYGALNE